MLFGMRAPFHPARRQSGRRGRFAISRAVGKSAQPQGLPVVLSHCGYMFVYPLSTITTLILVANMPSRLASNFT